MMRDSARERHPVVAAVDAGLEHRAQPRIGVRDPFEGRAVDAAVRPPAPPRRPVARGPRPAAGSPCPAAAATRSACASHSSGWPNTIGVRLPAKTWARISSQRIAWPTVSRIGHGLGSHVGDDVQLRVRTLPLAEHAQQLRQEDAQVRVGGLGAHRRGERPARPADRRRATRLRRRAGIFRSGSPRMGLAGARCRHGRDADRRHVRNRDRNPSQNRAWRAIVAPHAGQLLWVLAMSKPHSWQKRPPCEGIWQFGHTAAEAEAAAAACAPRPCASHFEHRRVDAL